MANSHRGEVDVTIAGKSYPVAMSLDAVARISTALGISTMAELEQRLPTLQIGDMKPALAAILAGNGHEIDEAALGAIHWRTYAEMLAAIWNAKPGAPAGEDTPSPQKRAK